MVDIEAPIKDVTVYSDRALVTRRGTIQLEAGEHVVAVDIDERKIAAIQAGES